MGGSKNEKYTLARICGILEHYSVIFKDGNSTKDDVLDSLVDLAASIAERHGIEEYQ